MNFRSEWLLEDPIEVMTDFEKKVFSKDEIESLSTDENFSEVEKALYLLEKGQLSQKLWVVRSLDSFIEKTNSEQIIAELIDRLPYWNEAGQIEAGKSFAKVLLKGFFPEKYYENLLLLILHIIETDSWPLQEPWAEVFSELSTIYPQRCLSEALTLSVFNQTDNLRSIAGHVLVTIVHVKKCENCEDIIKKIYLLAQDPAYVVRKNMCKSLKNLVKAFSLQKIENSLMPELVKLVEDDSAEVLADSLSLFSEIMELCGYDCQEKTMEMLKPTFFQVTFNKVGKIKLKNIGKVVVSMRLGIDEDFKKKCVNWFCAYEELNEEEVKVSLAYNFPAILFVTGSMNDQLFRIFKLLESSDNWEVKRIIAKQIGDVCRISRGKEQELLKIVKGFIENPKTLEIVTAQFYVIANSLKNIDFFLENLTKQLLMKLPWRKNLVILKELTNFCSHFNFFSVQNQLLDILFELLKTSCMPIKTQSANLLSEIVYKLLPRKEEICNKIVNELAKSFLSNCRISFIYFCFYFSKIASHQLFCKEFICWVISLAYDKVTDVVYSFAKFYLDFLMALPLGDIELMKQFKSILYRFYKSNDKFLVQTASEIDEKFEKVVHEAHRSGNEIKENLKIKAEKEAMDKEAKENQNIFIVRKAKKIRTINSRGGSCNPIKRHSLGEIDKKELSRYMQKINTKKRVK